jgi:hypothetical protein
VGRESLLLIEGEDLPANQDESGLEECATHGVDHLGRLFVAQVEVEELGAKRRRDRSGLDLR